jgi:hypothetical protein
MTTPSPRPAPETKTMPCHRCERVTEHVRKSREIRPAFKHIRAQVYRAWVCVTCNSELP